MAENKLKKQIEQSKVSQVTAEGIMQGSFSDEIRKENPEMAEEIEKNKRKGRRKSDKPTKKEKLSFAATADLRAKLEEACEKTNRNMSNYICNALMEAFKKDLAE